MEHPVVASDVEILVDLLEDCWSSVIRKIDGSDIETVREMVDQSRGQDGAALGRAFRDLAFKDLDIQSQGPNGLHAAFLLAFGYVAGLKLDVERGPVSMETDLARRAFFHAHQAHERILGAGRKARVAKATKAALKRSEVLYAAEKALVLQLLKARTGGWMSKKEALDWIHEHLPETGTALTHHNRRDTYKRWMDNDTLFQQAYEEGLQPAT